MEIWKAAALSFLENFMLIIMKFWEIHLLTNMTYFLLWFLKKELVNGGLGMKNINSDIQYLQILEKF